MDVRACRQCGAELTGKRVNFCSDRCRKQLSRNLDKAANISPDNQTRTTNPDSQHYVRVEGEQRAGTGVPETVFGGNGKRDDSGVKVISTTQKRYAQRAKPELLNYGDHMNAEKLADAGLTANRVAIPGDHDYDGRDA